MRKEYKYSNLKQETNTSGKVMLEPSKRIKKIKPRIRQGQKAPEWFSSWVKNQYEKDIKHINKRLDKHDEMFEIVFDKFKKHKWIK